MNNSLNKTILVSRETCSFGKNFVKYLMNKKLKKLSRNFSYNSLENNFLNINDIKIILNKNFKNLIK
jgi:hypothetical protein|tara:strand:+ start:2752 stop:2952 length:201 start_codon:yes stop_codon:yes gene_type:complete